LTVISLPFVFAPYEADEMLAAIAKQGGGVVVLFDSDMLALSALDQLQALRGGGWYSGAALKYCVHGIPDNYCSSTENAVSDIGLSTVISKHGNLEFV
jgi:hypothetical protein